MECKGHSLIHLLRTKTLPAAVRQVRSQYFSNMELKVYNADWIIKEILEYAQSQHTTVNASPLFPNSYSSSSALIWLSLCDVHGDVSSRLQFQPKYFCPPAFILSSHQTTFHAQFLLWKVCQALASASQSTPNSLTNFANALLRVLPGSAIPTLAPGMAHRAPFLGQRTQVVV